MIRRETKLKHNCLNGIDEVSNQIPRTMAVYRQARE